MDSPLSGLWEYNVIFTLVMPLFGPTPHIPYLFQQLIYLFMDSVLVYGYRQVLQCVIVSIDKRELYRF